MARRASRRDNNHAAIVAALHSVNAVVMQAAEAPALGFDLLVAYCGQIYIIEIKDGRKPPSERRLTTNEQAQQAALARHGVEYHIVLSEDDALRVIGAIR